MAGGERNVDDDLNELARRFDKLEEHASRRRIEAIRAASDLDKWRDRALLHGHATPEGSRRLQNRFAGPSSFHRVAQDLAISSVGIGTSRGAADLQTDAAYVDALHGAMLGGVNLIDTSINYRFQRSEVAVGSALRILLETGAGDRDEIILCSKGGFLVPGAFSAGSIPGDEVEAGFHSIAAPFLADQIDRSRRNIGVATIDIYYLHNPEVQAPFIGRAALDKRLAAAFDQLERSVSDGKIRHYGIATWNGFHSGALSLSAIAKAARAVGGEDHHLRFVQLPFNQHIQFAAVACDRHGRTVLDVAEEAGISVIASASLGVGREPVDDGSRESRSPGDVAEKLQFVRSTRGITSALVGMRRLAHVKANLAIVASASPERARETPRSSK